MLRALSTLLAHVPDRHHHEFVVIGGLNPELLTLPAKTHAGTNDVDLLLQVAFRYDRDDQDFSWLEQALDRAGFVDPGSGCVWFLDIDGATVKLELLTDVPGEEGNHEIPLPGCTRASAWNMQGPEAAAEDTRVEHVDVGGQSVSVRFAALGGYVVAKACAYQRRRAAKDVYDVVFVLIHNTAGGPAEAARAVVTGVPEPVLSRHEADLRATLTRVSQDDDVAAIYADESLAAGDEAEHAQLIEDAVSAALAFLRAYDAARGVGAD